MNIVLFGGAFNPPHLGHLLVIQQAFELIRPPADELWLLPAYKHTFQKQLNSPSNRVNMLKLLHDQLPLDIKSKIKIETAEIDNQLSGETHDALKILQQKYPQHHFSFLMGSDNIKSFKKWGNWQKLLEEMPFYIYPRSGYRQETLLENMKLLESDTQTITNFSSTLIKNRIVKNLALTNLIPQPILNYIKKHNLYQ